MASSRRFFPALESLRGVAALTVALFHLPWAFPGRESGPVRNGYLWVDFFFVLSGFVISQSYAERLGDVRAFGRFLALRLGRIYPLHLVLTLVFLAFEVARWQAQRHGAVSAVPAFSVNGGWPLVANLLMLHACGVTSQLSFNLPSWSIGAEFWTYVVFGLCAWLFAKRLTAVAVVLMGVSAAVLWHAAPVDLDLTFDLGFVRCVLGFFAGVLIRQLPWRRPLLPAWVPVAALGLAATFLALKDRGASDFASPAVFAVVVWAFTHAEPVTWLEATPLLWLGKVSYSVYLVHTLLIMGFAAVIRRGLHLEPRDSVFATSPTVGLALTGALVLALLAVSGLTWRWVEEPFRQRAVRRFKT